MTFCSTTIAEFRDPGMHLNGVMERLIAMQCPRHREDLARDTSFYRRRGEWAGGAFVAVVPLARRGSSVNIRTVGVMYPVDEWVRIGVRASGEGKVDAEWGGDDQPNVLDASLRMEKAAGALPVSPMLTPSVLVGRGRWRYTPC